MELTGRNIILTGATGGLGTRVAEALFAAGAQVLLVGRDADRLEAIRSRAKFQASVCVCDLAVPWDRPTVVPDARGQWDQLHGLVNCVGTQGPVKASTDVTVQEWEMAFRLNLTVPMMLSRDAALWMSRTGGGSIVNLSGGGAANVRPMFAPYGASKAALVRFSETFAAEMATHRVRVNCVAPGRLPTNMLRNVIHAGPERAGQMEYESACAAFSSPDAVDPFRPAVELILALLTDRYANVTGKLISAVWDDWKHLPETVDRLSKDVYTLRRILPEDRL